MEYYFCILLIHMTFSISAYGNDDVLNCTAFPAQSRICRKACNEAESMQYSASFCESSSGDCICDCRNVPADNCTRDPDTSCNLYCETKNPNPEVFTYIGTTCPISITADASRNLGNILNGQICSCMCSLNADYEETNDI